MKTEHDLTELDPRSLRTEPLDVYEVLRSIEKQLSCLPSIKAQVSTMALEIHGEPGENGMKARLAIIENRLERRVWTHPLVVSLLLGGFLALVGCAVVNALG